MATDSEILALADMRLSPAELRLYAADGRPVAIERKAFDLIAYLVQQRDRVVSKDELLQAVWGRSIASDSVVAQAVSKARKALANGGGEADWIDVARGVGYRYTGPAQVWLVDDLPQAEEARAQARFKRTWQRRWFSAAALLVTALLGIGAGIAWQQRALQQPLRIAVLPFRDESGDASLAWTELGLQGLMLDALASDRRIATVPQGSIRTLLAARPDMVDAKAQAEYLGSASGASHVYAGRLTRDESSLVVELVVLSGAQMSSLRLTGDEPAGLAQALGSRATQGLLPGFDPARPAPLSSLPYANQAYARGLDARLRGRAEESVQHLQSALASDPAMLAARFQLSVSLQQLRRNAEWLAALQQLQAEATARGDRLHQGLALGGLGVFAWREGQYSEAEDLIRQSRNFFEGAAGTLRLAGANANLGSLAAIQGRFAEAEAHLQDALRSFETAGSQVEIARVAKNLGVMEIDRGRFAEARPHFERSRQIRHALGLERDLAETLVSLGVADLGLEAPEAARASLERAVEIFQAFKDPLQESDALARLAGVHIALGKLELGMEAAARSLVSARLADNAAAMGLAHLRLAQIARLSGDHTGAEAELDRAATVWTAANEEKGLLNVSLARTSLLPVEQREHARLATQDVLRAAQARGWAGLELEALLQLAEFEDESSASAELRLQAFELAQRIGEPAAVTQSACAVAMHARQQEPVRSADAQQRCADAAERNAVAARYLALRAQSEGDREASRRWWLRCRDLSGERWTAQDQVLLDAAQET